jgi:hypothetical protein
MFWFQTLSLCRALDQLITERFLFSTMSKFILKVRSAEVRCAQPPPKVSKNYFVSAQPSKTELPKTRIAE